MTTPNLPFDVFDGRFHDLVDDLPLRRVGDGFGFPEGPVMLPEGFLVFSDIANDSIIRFSRPGRTGIHRQPSGGANGNTLDVQGRLVTCEAGRRRVTRTEHDGSVTTLADRYEGKRLNAPNDIVVKSDGAVYFTDPVFLGEDDEMFRSSYMELDFNGVFRISPQGGLSLLTSELRLCNGLAFSPDESILYVVNSEDDSVYAFDVNSDGSISNMRRWLDMTAEMPGVGDGMKIDVLGNAYVTGPGGVWVADSEGTPLGIIRTPVAATNMAFYGFDSKVLFITAPPAIFAVRLRVGGISVLGRIVR